MPTTPCRNAICARSSTSIRSAAARSGPGCSRSCATSATPPTRSAAFADQDIDERRGRRCGARRRRRRRAQFCAARDEQSIRDMVSALPEPFREAIVLREINDLSYRDIAEIVGAPVGTVMSRLARARVDAARGLAGGRGEGRHDDVRRSQACCCTRCSTASSTPGMPARSRRMSPAARAAPRSLRNSARCAGRWRARTCASRRRRRCARASKRRSPRRSCARRRRRAARCCRALRLARRCRRLPRPACCSWWCAPIEDQRDRR